MRNKVGDPDQISSGITIIDEQLLKYDYIEQRIMPLSNVYGGGIPLPINSRSYFGANKQLKGKRIIAISFTSGVSNYSYNGITIVTQLASLAIFTITIVNNKGEEVIKDMPITQLARIVNAGKIRIFNVLHNIEESYIINTGSVVPPNIGLAINFFTTRY